MRALHAYSVHPLVVTSCPFNILNQKEEGHRSRIEDRNPIFLAHANSIHPFRFSPFSFLPKQLSGFPTLRLGFQQLTI